MCHLIKCLPAWQLARLSLKIQGHREQMLPAPIHTNPLLSLLRLEQSVAYTWRTEEQSYLKAKVIWQFTCQKLSTHFSPFTKPSYPLTLSSG